MTEIAGLAQAVIICGAGVLLMFIIAGVAMALWDRLR